MNIVISVWKWLTSSKPNNLLTITLALIAGLASYLGATHNVNNLRVDLSQKMQSNQNVAVVNQPQKVVLASENLIASGNKGSFNPDNWNFAYDLPPDKEGYYCPGSPAFPSWFMWSKSKYKVDFNIKISFSLLDKTDDDKNPTLYVSYGDKTGNAPDSYYRINIFDGDSNTLRLYGRDGNSLQFERSAHDASLNNFVTFSLSPTFFSNRSSTLILNPSLSYKVNGRQYDFYPSKIFQVELPFTSSDDQGDGFQYGIGISKGDCFKIISSNI